MTQVVSNMNDANVAFQNGKAWLSQILFDESNHIANDQFSFESVLGLTWA